MRLCSNNQLFLQKWDEANAAIDAQCSERLHRAHCVNSVFSLHALAAWKMLQQRKIQCCRAAEKPAIRAECSKDQRLNSQTADKVAIGLVRLNGSYADEADIWSLPELDLRL